MSYFLTTLGLFHANFENKWSAFINVPAIFAQTNLKTHAPIQIKLFMNELE